MKYHPIGTVVTLKNGDRPILIYGRKQIQAGLLASIDTYMTFYNTKRPHGTLNYRTPEQAERDFATKIH